MAEAEFAAPARKSYRGKGKGRDRGPARRKHPSAGKQHKDSEQKESAPAPASLKGDDTNAEEGEGEAGQNDLDLEKLLDQVSNDHWYALPGNNSASFQWPHLDEVPLGFELEALQVDLPKVCMGCIRLMKSNAAPFLI